MEIILSIVVVILKILNYVDVILQKIGIKMYSITKESLLQGLSTNILIFISKCSYVITEVDFVCQTLVILQNFFTIPPLMKFRLFEDVRESWLILSNGRQKKICIK